MALINGIYLEKLENDGLAVHQITRCLGRSTLDVGQLCGDVNAAGVRQYRINKWAKYKPEAIPQRGDIDDKLRAQNDYGFVTESIAAKGVAGDALKNLFKKAQDLGFDWPYTPAKAPYFRVLDFNGYNHEAKAPYTVPHSGSTKVLPTEIEVIREWGPEVEIQLEDMRAVQALDIDYNAEDFYLAVLTWKKGTDEVKLFVSETTLQEMNDEASARGDRTEFSVPVTLTEGETQCLFVLTTVQKHQAPGGVIDASAEGLEDDVCIWLPGCVQTYRWSAVQNAILLNTGEDFFLKLYTDNDLINPSLRAMAAQVILTNANTGAGQNVSVTIEVVFWEDAQHQTTLSQIRLAAEQVVYETSPVTLNIGPQETPDPVQSVEGYPHGNIGIRMSWQWGSNTRYFNFDNPGTPITPSQSVPAPGFATLADIESKGYTILSEVKQQ